MYHINIQGKVYPCRARVRSCPYERKWHAETKEELYYKISNFSPIVEISSSTQDEIDHTGRLRSLFSLSPTLEIVPYPIEYIIKNLKCAIALIEDTNPQHLKQQWDDFVENAGEIYAETLSYGIEEGFHVPSEVRQRGRELFNERRGGRVIEFASATGNKQGERAFGKLRKMIKDFEAFEEYRVFGLTEANKEATLGWLKRDFSQFSHDLNTSKMLTRPIFYGNIKEAKEKIKELDDYELLGAYDDYLILDKEIMENVKLANNFEFASRQDLSREANINIRKWYDRNKSIVNNWVENTPKRVLLSMEMAKELDRRGIYRQDNRIGLSNHLL